MSKSFDELKDWTFAHLYKFKWGTTAILMAFLGWLDYLTGHELRFAPLYLIPIFFATWSLGKKEGLATSVLCTAIWFTVNLLAGMSYSNSWVALWNIFIRQFSYSIFVVVLDNFKTQRERGEHDYLTNIFNKRIFYECASRELARCRRYRKPISIGYIDCDNFKQVNDQQGHEAGDRLLKIVAKTISKELRGTDVVARLGGDEFAVLLPGTDSDVSRDVFKKVRGELLSVMRKNHFPVTFSVGVVTYRSSPDTVEEMLQKADQLMYSVKKSTKNNIEHEVVYASEHAVV